MVYKAGEGNVTHQDHPVEEEIVGDHPWRVTLVLNLHAFKLLMETGANGFNGVDAVQHVDMPLGLDPGNATHLLQ